MIPENTLSSEPHVSGFSYPVKQPGDFLVDWELAGVALNDPSQGLAVKLWTLEALRNKTTGLQDVTVSAPGVAPTVLFSDTGITEVALAFDQNMNPFVAYQQESAAKIYWYDPTTPGMTHTTLPAGCYDLRCTLDDKRSFSVANSDIVLSYIRAGNLCVRYQRERFGIETILRSGIGTNARLVSMAMNSGSRMQWRLHNHTLTNGSGALLQTDPFLADVVADLLRRSNVSPEHIDTDQLWVPIEGYRIANEAGADSNIAPLQAAWFFDPGEWDKKLRFILRGGDPVAHLTFDDLLERTSEDAAMEIERVQQIELLRKVNVTMVDSTAGWVPNKQSAERRSTTIKAVGEASTVLPITAHPDFTATVAIKRLRVPWAEPNKFTYSVGIPWSALTPTDVIAITDRSGRVYQQRLGQTEEDFGSFAIEASTNAKWVYEQKAVGTGVPPSIPTVPGEAGDTVPVILDIPVMRDQNDELGYYVAVLATGDGWNGGLLQISLDGGATILQTLDVDVPSLVGETVTALIAEVSSEYLSDQTLRITMVDQPESVSYDDILRYRNLVAVQRADGSWEILQFETVTAVNATTFDLSGLVRGRYATTPIEVPVGARFVLLDNSVQFIQMQQWMIGETVSYRGITYNQNADDVPWGSFVVTNPQTQTEWPVHYVKATRDSSDNVTVSWIGRARLGVEVAPHNSKYFGGYRVIYSDGYTADVLPTVTTHTRAAAPAGVTIHIAAVNVITGAGPLSEGVTVP